MFRLWTRTARPVRRQQLDRNFSQMMADFVQPKYFEAYKALLMAQLKPRGLGEAEANQVILNASKAVASASDAKVRVEPHVLAAQLALSTADVVAQAKGSQEAGFEVARDTLLSSQIFETSTHKVATLLSWNKKKHAAKMSRDFCKDQARALEATFDESTCAVNVKKCYYADFFTNAGHPELTKVFCIAEKALFESASAPKSGLDFKQNQTIADGADRCVFKFESKE